MKLTATEESAIVQHVLDLDARGFPPTKDMLRDMANKLLAERHRDPVGKLWPDNFIKRTPELKTRWTRRYDRQRALNEDSQALEAWFKLVRSTKAKYGILDQDTFNFDETGFMMGVISSQLVVTGAHRRGKAKLVQPGSRVWTTVIQGINASGWAIPPYIIFVGKAHLSAWYEDKTIPRDWVLGVSDNGWTTNAHGIAWLKHFNEHTKTRTVGSHRLLIIDGHESHHSLEFQDLCAKEEIITLCMPPHSSHLLQPLDVGCFGPLKRAYGSEVSDLTRQSITHITKMDFLAAFKTAFSKAFTKDNICGSFRGAGLVPFNPEVVISRLDVRLRTPTPPLQATIWESRTPSNAKELQSQSTLIRERIQRHQNSSPTSILESVNQFTKGAEMMVHSAVLIRDQVSILRKAAEAASERKSRKRRYIQKQGALTIEEGTQLCALDEGSREEGAETPAKRVCTSGGAPQQRRCGRCGKTGHNSRTCHGEASEQENVEEASV